MKTLVTVLMLLWCAGCTSSSRNEETGSGVGGAAGTATGGQGGAPGGTGGVAGASTGGTGSAATGGGTGGVASGGGGATGAVGGQAGAGGSAGAPVCTPTDAYSPAHLPTTLPWLDISIASKDITCVKSPCTTFIMTWSTDHWVDADTVRAVGTSTTHMVSLKADGAACFWYVDFKVTVDLAIFPGEEAFLENVDFASTFNLEQDCPQAPVLPSEAVAELAPSIQSALTGIVMPCP